MKKKFLIAAVLMAAALTGMLLTTTVPTYAEASSNTHIKANIKQSTEASGLDTKAQNCAENNLDSTITSGDEQLDCHNNQPSQEISASD